MAGSAQAAATVNYLPVTIVGVDRHAADAAGVLLPGHPERRDHTVAGYGFI